MKENSGVVPKAEILDTQQCWKLLRETTIGRLAVTADGSPDVFPVNYKVDQETKIFRTGDGTKLSALEADANVALEADAVSAEFGIAWSVVVKGRAVVVTTTTTTLDTIGRALFPWDGVNKEHFIRIVPDTVTGKHLTLAAPM
ncbi:flavin-nucleotide-binding protein [Arthrobacter livingstonensis]|uniref:Flavin-nucleotide-binding protein n=1 Tax=Arthrobacter livingstonensis TaxID=670078 RepID=A0A2V5L0M2_9MICC|nr:pyridoxamine 5'-phosphate oxidase family protein [Arthrobacter livingstonensis]PYI64548.1 flavin-nucleotide-binding protein [Arthrobacter livingstonensis]